MKPDIIFLDTTIFVKENFLEGARIKLIFELSSNGYFELYLSVITLNEIKFQFKKRVRAALIKHNELINDKTNNVRVLRNNSDGKAAIQKLPNEKTICAEFNVQLDYELKKAGVIILDYPTLNLTNIFENYFGGQPPFNISDKKSEFPDALVIAHIEQWCQINSKKAIILSKDKDFVKIINKNFKVICEYEKFLEDKVKEIAKKRTDCLEKLYIKKSNSIDHDFIEYVEDEFYNESIFNDVVNWMDIHTIDVDHVYVVSKEYEIVNDDKENFEIEVTATIDYKVRLEIDDEESSFYDSEDKVVLFRETKKITLEQKDLQIPFKLIFNIVDDEDYDDDYDIIEKNNGKDIELEPEG